MIKSVISVMTAAVIGSGTIQLTASSLSATANALYTVRFLDFDGNTFYTLSVPAGQRIDSKILSSIDTSGLSRQLDTHTQQRFSSWWGVPDYVDSDVYVKPLSIIGTISLEKLPDKKQYFSLESDISKAGLVVNITLETQTGINADGSYITKKEYVDISSTCTLNCSTAKDAFKSDNKATVKIYPINSAHPIGNYEISYIEGIADVDNDDIITGSDATLVLREYTLLSSDPDNYKVDESVLKFGDMDFDGVITGSDATLLLRYYTLKSSDSEYTLDMFFDEN
ncbi:MAG: hypothetical protein IKK47_05490 [Ruminococcus sp.]|nr:hypothetical protein [Ruminococcus sp.]